MSHHASTGARTPLRELALVFLKLGATSFGGPAVHVALMEEEFVARRRWLTRAEFLDLLGMTNLIPGPNSTELAIHIGRARAGAAGLVVAGASFILPAMCAVLALAWAYVRYGSLPVGAALAHGLQPVVLAIVVQALVRLARAAVKTKTLAAIGVASLAANALGVHELVVLLAAALVGASIVRDARTTSGASALLLAIPQAAPLAAVPATAGGVFLFFLKVGSVLFGSGYVLLAFLRADLVERWGWLTEAQLLDAIAAGQITPGPLFTTATFIGYVLGGWSWALLATLGIFLPAFVFVALSAPLVPLLRRSPRTAAVLDAVNVASLALMLIVTLHLARAALTTPLDLALTATTLALLLAARVNAMWLIAGGALIALLRHTLS